MTRLKEETHYGLTRDIEMLFENCTSIEATNAVIDSIVKAVPKHQQQYISRRLNQT